MIENQVRAAEESVLGSIFLDGNLMKDTILMPKHFYFSQHQVIFKKMRELEEKNEPIELVSVMMGLGNTLEQAGGSTYLNKLAFQSPSTASFNFYTESVLEGWRQREALKLTSKLNEHLKVGELEAIHKITDQLTGLSEVGLVDEFDLSDELLELYEDMQQEKGGLTGIDTGYNELNNLTNGFQDQDFIVVGARPSVGKTAFALNIGSNAAEKGTAVGIFSLEMGKQQLLKRIASSVGHINGMKMKNARQFFDVRDWERFSNSVAMINKWKMEIWDKPGITIQEIYAQVRKFKRKHQDKQCLIVIDYLQLIIGDRKHGGNRMQEISEISRKLKIMARELNVCVVALSQLSRGVEARQDKRPMLSDLRESGQIEQDADLIAFLYRDDYYHKDSERKNMIEIILAKQRNGPVGTVQLAFVKEFNKFVNLERRFEEQKGA
ncbi:replicative DNA helicase [Priestia taiwanensis]|uniref:Replicative DNA helicase n=1 Tax=Priestia taiwanensis TaxID=1347902 RepID=A0A917AK45_9BACI|nr:replicative DNA helicase [Priestia taiwanensis]MBM7361970.1 replicative DNA helicase [Priestia taiwanensis]GGE58430.1 replicative DNA helicase [Priestia taiwanensis]